MKQKTKTSFFIKLLACFVLLFSTLGVLWFGVNPWKSEVTASAETTDITNSLVVGNWGTPEASNVRHLSLEYTESIVCSYGFEYWNDHAVDGAAANDGIDVMEYILIDGESVRSIVTKNQEGTTTFKGPFWPFEIGGVFSPVQVAGYSYGTAIKVLMDYKTEFQLTFKAGFQLITSAGKTLKVTSDVDFLVEASKVKKVQKSTITFNKEDGSVYTTKSVSNGQNIGELPAVPTKSGYVGYWMLDGNQIDENYVVTANKTFVPFYALEYQDALGLNDVTSAWAAGGDQYVFQGIDLANNSKLLNTNSGDNDIWNVFSSLVSKNNGCDILDYIYVENENVQGKSARTIGNENIASNQYVGTSGWLTRVDCCPIFVQTTNGSGMVIRILKAFAGDSFTITFKKGFTIQLANNGEWIYLSNDVTFIYANNTLTRKQEYTLSFEGLTETKRVLAGRPVGTLPEVPAKDGLQGMWMIDGVELTEDTVLTANKTAVASYYKDITDTIALGDWGVPATESDLRYLWIREGEAEIGAVYPYEFWNDHLDNKNSNYGVDIMEYVFVDGESVRSIINKNATDRTYKGTTSPFSYGGVYAPITIATKSSGIRFKVMLAYKTSFNVTFKAGLTFINTDGIRLYVSRDVTYHVGEKAGDISKLEGCILSFEGLSETKTLSKGQTIGALPEVPEKSGFKAIGWAIDGEMITADTVYNYSGNKTASAVYTKIAQIASLDDKFTVSTWGMQEDKVWIHGEVTGFKPVAVKWHQATAEEIAANNGVSPLDYIFINGISAREHLEYDSTCMQVATYTGWAEALVVKVEPSYLALGAFTVQYKAGLVIGGQDGVMYTLQQDTAVYGWINGAFGTANCTLSFEGISDTVEVVTGQSIGELPAVPEKENAVGVWTIDGVEITAETIYTYAGAKTAVAAYSREMTKDFALEDRAWGAAQDEYYLGVLDMGGTYYNGEGKECHYLNAAASFSGNGVWYAGTDKPINANGGIDIMEYIYVNGKSARALITENANSSNPMVGSNGWLTNKAASPVYVETTGNSGILIKILKAYAGEYFEITFKSGFSLLNVENVRVYLTQDITYKYVNGALSKGKITDADLDQLNGNPITLMNGGEIYLAKKTVRLTLPELDAVAGDENTLSQVFVGWSTAPDSVEEMYPAGYKWDVTEETTLYAVWISFGMQDGAAVRLTEGSSGIRFLVDINAEQLMYLYDEIGSLYCWGVLLVPTDYLSEGVPFVHESFPDGYYIDKECDLWSVGGEDAEGETVWTYAAAFTNISKAQYNRSFSARGYLLIEYADGNTYYVYTPYSAENNARSIYEVATKAYKDTANGYSNSPVILEYVNKVADVTLSDDYVLAQNPNAVGAYELELTLSETTITVKSTKDIVGVNINGVRMAKGRLLELRGLYFEVESCTISGNTAVIVLNAPETMVKESAETLYFESSDAELDFFLNDYFQRHSGYVDENGVDLKVNSVTAGVNSEEFFSQEWMSMSYYWFNSYDGYDTDRIAGLRKFLSSVPVDDYGYVWSSNDRVRDNYTTLKKSEQKMGWPFPSNETVSTTHWEFNGDDSKSWTDNVGGSVANGLRSAKLSNQTSDVIFSSNTWKSYTSGKIYTYYAPLLEFEVRIDDATNIDDIYVGYTTSAQTSMQWVSVKDYAFIAYDYSGAFNHIIYMPMYAFSGWGASTSTYITQIQIKIDIKDGKSLSGNVGLNYVRPTFDTRMSNNNSVLISSLRTDYDYTGDLTYLQENITRARKAMNFLMQMYDATRGLKKESYLVGHDGKKEDLTWLGKATNDSIAGSLSQGYWDILFMPEYDFQSNMYFYKALVDLAYLEDVLTANGITVDKSLATVKTANRSYETSTSAYSSSKLKSVANTVLVNLQKTTSSDGTGFWNATEGRFVAGYSTYESKWYDYGYVTWNLEAIYYGIATDAQAAAIMNWLESEQGLYDYVFAPKSNTVTGDAGMLNGEYEAKGNKWVNCQFGGAIMYSSFYDLMARIDTLGADNAFARLTAIQEWYYEVYNYYVAHGSDPNQFYRYYYESLGIQMQGKGTQGAIGIDAEFLESLLPVSAVAYGFFGIDSIDGKTLEIAPEKPSDLSYWKMENLSFNMVKYDLTILDGAIQITNVRGSVEGLGLQIVLDYTAGQTVYVNGKAVSPVKVENGKAYVNVAFGAVIVEVR